MIDRRSLFQANRRSTNEAPIARKSKVTNRSNLFVRLPMICYKEVDGPPLPFQGAILLDPSAPPVHDPAVGTRDASLVMGSFFSGIKSPELACMRICCCRDPVFCLIDCCRCKKIRTPLTCHQVCINLMTDFRLAKLGPIGEHSSIRRPNWYKSNNSNIQARVLFYPYVCFVSFVQPRQKLVRMQVAERPAMIMLVARKHSGP